MSFASTHKVCIAPMMQYTDMHDRYLLRLISKKVFLYTEMVTTGAILYGKCFHQLEYNQEEHPVSVQLGGSEIKDLVESAKISENYGYDEINLNVGCPSDRVQKGRFGACLMLEPNHVADCLSAMKNNVSIPVSIKCRLGVDHHDTYEFLYNFVERIRSFLDELNCDALLHAVAQFFFSFYVFIVCISKTIKKCQRKNRMTGFDRTSPLNSYLVKFIQPPLVINAAV